jgi:CheY-like chemotaxis protein
MHPLKILDLEDSPFDVELIKHTLKKGGIECEIMRVGTREDFLQALETGKFDLILGDYNLPSFDSLTALKLVREKSMTIPFIFVSGTAKEELIQEALKAGASDYIFKTDLEKLVPAVKRALRL